MYADRVIRRSFEYHNETGVLGPSPDPNLFFAARVLWDETMANAVSTTQRRDAEQHCLLLLSDRLLAVAVLQATKWLEEHPRN